MPNPEDDFPLLVFTMLASESDAQSLVHHLVASRLVACGTIIGGARSIYRWKGEVASEAEVFVMLKSRRGRWEALQAEVQDKHPYDVPELIAELGGLRDMIANGEQEKVLEILESARVARRNLPTTAPVPEQLTEMRIPVRDEKGEIASIATLAADLDVNIYDLEIAHSAEGPRGVMIALVDSDLAERLHGGLMALGYRPSLTPLT